MEITRNGTVGNELSIENPCDLEFNLSFGVNMRKKRILVCIPTIEPGGAERSVCVLSNGLVNAGYDVTILLDHLADPKKGIYPLDSRIQIENLPLMKYSDGLLQLWETRRNFLKYKADCVIGFLWKSNVAIAMSLQFSKTPIILSEQADMNYDLSSFNN